MSSTGPYVVDQLDTDGLPQGDAADAWAELTRDNHGVAVRFADPATFRGRTTVQQRAGHQLVHFSASSAAYARTGRAVRGDDDDGLRLLVSTTGDWKVRQNGVSVRAGPGQAALVTKRLPFDGAPSPSARSWVLSIPAGSLPFDAEAGPALLDLGTGLGPVIVGMAEALKAQRRDVDGPGFSLVCDRITELLDLCLKPRPELPGTLATVDTAVRDHVRRHAADPDLNPAAIARALGWSLRQIQLAMRSSGTTPSEVLRTVRLDLARNLLRDEPPGRTIADIAHASGFRSLNTFGAAFKERFGLTPRQARASRDSGS